MGQMVTLVEKLNGALGGALKAATAQPRKLRGRAIVAKTKLVQLRETMSKLLPQIRY
jgi:hypothetical protein